jgi:hypothetical protein
MQPAEQAQQLAGGNVAPPGMGGGAPEPPASPLGALPGAPPPSMPGFPEIANAPGGAAPLSGPPPIADLFSKVNAALAAAAPWLRGHIVSALPLAADRIEVSYTDPHDKQAIGRAFAEQNLKVKYVLRQGHNPIPV